MTNILPQKECPRCKKSFPHTEGYFHKDKSQKSGLKSRCKQCMTIAASGYYSEHREEVLETKRVHRIEHHDEYVQRDRDRYYSTIEYQKQRHARYRHENRDAVLERTRDWRRRNPEHIKAYSRQYHQDNIDRQRAKARNYYRNHLEERLAYAKSYNASRRAMERAQGKGYSLSDVRLQYRSQHGKCWHCFKLVGNRFHVDHLIPLKKGGKHDASNIVISCPLCNLSKKDKLCYRWNGRLF